MKLRLFFISALLLFVSCKGSSQTQQVNIGQTKCKLEEFLNCAKEEVRQFCQQDIETLVGFRSPTCLECPEMSECLI